MRSRTSEGRVSKGDAVEDAICLKVGKEEDGEEEDREEADLFISPLANDSPQCKRDGCGQSN
jgi:hypothetical protein